MASEHIAEPGFMSPRVARVPNTVEPKTLKVRTINISDPQIKLLGKKVYIVARSRVPYQDLLVNIQHQLRLTTGDRGLKTIVYQKYAQDRDLTDHLLKCMGAEVVREYDSAWNAVEVDKATPKLFVILFPHRDVILHKNIGNFIRNHRFYNDYNTTMVLVEQYPQMARSYETDVGFVAREGYAAMSKRIAGIVFESIDTKMAMELIRKVREDEYLYIDTTSETPVPVFVKTDSSYNSLLDIPDEVIAPCDISSWTGGDAGHLTFGSNLAASNSNSPISDGEDSMEITMQDALHEADLSSPEEGGDNSRESRVSSHMDVSNAGVSSSSDTESDRDSDDGKDDSDCHTRAHDKQPRKRKRLGQVY